MPRRISWRLKLPVLLVVFSAVPLAVAAYLTHQVLTQSYVKTTFDSLETIVRSQGAAVEQFSEDRQSEVQRIAQRIAEPTAEVIAAATAARTKTKDPEPLPALVDAEAIPKNRPKAAVSEEAAEVVPEADAVPQTQTSPEARLEEAKVELRRSLGLVLWDQTKFEEFLVMGTSGEVLVSTFPTHEDKTAADLDYFRNGLGATYVQPVFNSPITNRLTMVISSPVRDENAQVIGVLAARLNLSRFFGLITNTVGLGLSGETVVGKWIGKDIILMAPTRHAPNAPLSERFSVDTSFGLAMQKAAMGQQASERIVDYRGKCAYASWKPLPSLNWAMAVKLDCDEALGPVKQAYDDLIRLLLVVTLLALLGALVVAHALVAPINALRNAAESISRGDLDVHLPIPPGDEMGDLADSFERMVTAIRFFRAQSLGEEPDAVEDGEGADRTPGPPKSAPPSEKEEPNDAPRSVAYPSKENE